MRRFPTRCLLLLTFAAALYAPYAHAASLERQEYRRAFAAIDAGHADLAMSVARRGHDPVLNKIIRASYLAAPGNGASFEDTAAFIDKNADWPGLKDIIAMAEQKIPDGADPAMVVKWFSDHPPVSLVGFYRDADALSALGQTADALSLIRARWVHGDFDPGELTAFYARFGSLLGRDDIWARLDRLLWNDDVGDARRLFGLVDGDMKAVAEARLALAGEAPDADALYADVPDSWRDDPGLLYERLCWLRHQNRDDDAIEMLDRQPSDTGQPDAWWNERQIIAYRLMADGHNDLAYKLAASHGPLEGRSFAEAEFLAGWLALRFLNDPATAETHFKTLYDNATMPVTRARAAYWLGRAQEAEGDTAGAVAYYKTAAAFDTTYYGQLAEARIEKQPVLVLRPAPEPSPSARRTFEASEFVRAVEDLHVLGQKQRVDAFFRAAVDRATSPDDFALLTDLAARIGRPDLMIVTAKAANQNNVPAGADAFPLLHNHVPNVPEPAFTQALIRQESMFNPAAESAAGAKGLMQLEPHTAKAIARQIGIRFHAGELSNPSYNLRLGTAFIENQIRTFDGSYILALAGYNAGPHRVHEWIDAMGDPRAADVDPIDWIEMIPVAETRNYIQRVLEGLEVYRARLHGGRAPLLILKDLKR